MALQKTPKQVVDILDALLADLFDDKVSRIDLMKSDFITPDMIPDDLPKHRVILEGFLRCDEKGEPPTPEAVALFSLSRDPTIKDMCLELASHANTRPMVHPNAIWLRGYFQQELLSKASLEIAELAKIDYDDAAEKQSMMIDKLISLPISDIRQSYTRLELIEVQEEDQIRRVERAALNQALGGVLHLKGLRELAPVLEPGNLTLITAPPKSGKTTTAMILAELNANENNCDVLWLLFETAPTTIEQRFLARDLLLPSKALRTGQVDLRKPPYKVLHDQYKQAQADNWNTKGHMQLQYLAGAKLAEIDAQVRIHKRMADSRNRPLLVIVDYLQRIPKAANKTEVEAIAAISNFMLNLAVRYDCHIILFSQESFTAVAGDSRAHGSNTPIFVSQIHLTMKVLNTNQTIFVQDRHGNILKNLIGQDRTWQVKGNNRRQSVVRYDILRTNDNDTGACFAAFENSLFLMLDLTNKEDAWPFMRIDMDNFAMDLQNAGRKLI